MGRVEEIILYQSRRVSPRIETTEHEYLRQNNIRNVTIRPLQQNEIYVTSDRRISVLKPVAAFILIQSRSPSVFDTFSTPCDLENEFDIQFTLVSIYLPIHLIYIPELPPGLCLMLRRPPHPEHPLTRRREENSGFSFSSFVGPCNSKLLPLFANDL